MEATNYRFRQDPGGDVNSLGVVRINIANPYGVYMHDTPAKGYFRRRLPLRLVRLRAGPERARLCGVAPQEQSRLGSRPHRRGDPFRAARRRAAQPARANVYWVYITAWGTTASFVTRDDIYQRDGLGIAYQAPPPAQPVAQSARAPVQRLQPMNDDDEN